MFCQSWQILYNILPRSMIPGVQQCLWFPITHNFTYRIVLHIKKNACSNIFRTHQTVPAVMGLVQHGIIVLPPANVDFLVRKPQIFFFRTNECKRPQQTLHVQPHCVTFKATTCKQRYVQPSMQSNRRGKKKRIDQLLFANYSGGVRMQI